MAERAATRSSNRLNTPQSPPKLQQSAAVPQQIGPRRSARAARSQSRDVSDNEVVKPAVRGGRRGGRQVNASGRKGKNTTHAASVQVDPNLSQVPEETNIEYPEIKPHFLNGLAQAASQVAESPYSAFSGTTARTSRTAHEFKGYSAFDLLDALPDLSSGADKVLGWLVPVDEVSEEMVGSICNELQNNVSRTSKNVFRLGKGFEMHKDVYGGEAFMNPSVVVCALLGTGEIQGSENEPWRPDPILHKANLTTLITFITRPWEVVASARLVEFLDQNFPAAFVGPGFAADDFELALEIRTQHFILQLVRYIHELNFDPDMLLSQVFQNNPTTFKGWNSPGLGAEELSDEQRQAVGLRFQELGRNFSDGNAVDPEALKNAYPWLPFVTRVMAWSKARLSDIGTKVNELGGEENLIRLLDQEIHGRINAGLIGNDGFRNDIQLEYPSPSQLPNANVTSDKNNIQKKTNLDAARRRSQKLLQNSAKTLGHRVARLKEIEKSVNSKKRSSKGSSQAPQTPTPNPTFAQPFPAAVAPMSNVSTGGHAPTANMVPMNTSAPAFEGITAPPLVDDNWQPAHVEDDMEQMQPNHFENGFTQQIVQLGDEREAAANKENIADTSALQGPSSPEHSQRNILGPRKLGIMDAQPNAHRVAFDSQAFQDMATSSAGAKRDFTTMDAEGDDVDEPSQDQGFQQDARTFDSASRRAQKPATTGRPPQRRKKKTRMAQAAQGLDEATQDGVHSEPNTQDDNEPPSSTFGAYQRSKSKAQEFASSQPKKVQVRKAWTDEETGLLLDLIEEHGTSWRLLKQIDDENSNILKDRDQVALKDKARNMKLDFLKAGTFLPLNFEHVPLNKLQIQKLTDLGLEYNQDVGRRRRQTSAQ